MTIIWWRADCRNGSMLSITAKFQRKLQFPLVLLWKGALAVELQKEITTSSLKSVGLPFSENLLTEKEKKGWGGRGSWQMVESRGIKDMAQGLVLAHKVPYQVPLPSPWYCPSLKGTYTWHMVNTRSMPWVGLGHVLHVIPCPSYSRISTKCSPCPNQSTTCAIFTLASQGPMLHELPSPYPAGSLGKALQSVWVPDWPL